MLQACSLLSRSLEIHPEVEVPLQSASPSAPRAVTRFQVTSRGEGRRENPRARAKEWGGQWGGGGFGYPGQAAERPAAAVMTLPGLRSPIH